MGQALEARMEADLVENGQPWPWPPSYSKAPVNPPADSQTTTGSISYTFVTP